MQLREPTNKLTGIAKTLMVTLYARAVETQRPESILSDRPISTTTFHQHL